MGGVVSSVTRTSLLQPRCALGYSENTLLHFHTVHGENVTLSHDCSVAKRLDSFCKGITFSNRPVRINEKINVKFLEIASSWSGSFRFGFTNHDPSALRGMLPKYACPDLTNRVGHWAKALPEHMVRNNVILFFYVSQTGDVHFGINNVENGVFFSGVDTQSSLWAVLDVYGNTVSIQLVGDQEHILNNQIATPAVEHGISAGSEPENLTRSLSNMNLSDLNVELPRSMSPDHVEDYTRIYDHDAQFEPFPLHGFHGRNIRLSNECSTAARLDTEFSQGYVFTAAPMPVNRWLTIQILHTEEMYVGALTFGLTSCNPAQLRVNELPDDSDNFLDRKEYWVVCKDVANLPVTGDRLAFYIALDGEVLLSKNGESPLTLMHVDETQKLWAFFDVYGNTQKIKLLGLVMDPSSCNRNTSSATRRVFFPETSSSFLHSEASGDAHNDNENNECTVCYERAVDSVLYTCGHMCMCYTCAIQQWRSQGTGQCPICRADIKDVIRIYRS